MSPPFSFSSRRIGVALVLLVAAAAYWVHWQERAAVRLILGAGPTDGDAFVLAQAISEVVRRYHPRVEILVVSSLGSAQSAELLESGRLDLAIIQAEIRTPPTARLVAPLFADAFQLLAREGSGILSPGQLRGKIVAIPPGGSMGSASFWLLASHYGMDESELTALPMSVDAATWAMRSGAVDALFLSMPLGSPVVRRVTEGGNAYVVGIDQAAAIRLNWPSVEVSTVPRGSYLGEPPLPPADLTTAAIRLLLTGREDLEPGLVQDITEVLFERRRELMEISPLAAAIVPPDRGIGTFMPIHEGAQRYYDRERPSFLQENAEVIALLLSLGALGLSSVLRMAQQGRRRRLEAYNSELLALYRDVKDSNDWGAVAEAKEETLQVLVRVLDDTEEGLVTEEGFHVFSLTWEAVYGALRDRLLLEAGPLRETRSPQSPGRTGGDPQRPGGPVAPPTPSPDPDGKTAG